jgi:tetratricopeptide (TPR) repeat protein
MEKCDESLADLTQALEFNNEDTWVLTLRAATHEQMGEYEEALADLNRVAEIDAEESWVYSRRSQTFVLAERYEEAITDLTRAIELGDEDDFAYVRRSEIFARIDRYEEAIADLGCAIELDDTDWNRYLRARLYQKAGQADQARADLLVAITSARETHETDANDWQNNLNLALYYLAHGEFEAAEYLYREPLEANIPTRFIRDAITDLNDYLTLFVDHSQALAMRVLLQSHLDSK